MHNRGARSEPNPWHSASRSTRRHLTIPRLATLGLQRHCLRGVYGTGGVGVRDGRIAAISNGLETMQAGKRIGGITDHAVLALVAAAIAI